MPVKDHFISKRYIPGSKQPEAEGIIYVDDEPYNIYGYAQGSHGYVGVYIGKTCREQCHSLPVYWLASPEGRRVYTSGHWYSFRKPETSNE